WINLFEITNRNELSLDYRLLAVRNLPPGDQYDKQLNQLAKRIRYETKQPVAIVRRGDEHLLAIPAAGRLPAFEQRLSPHVAMLEPEEGTHQLTLSHLDERTEPI